MKWSVAILAMLLVIAPFFIQVYPRPPLVTFNYFLSTLEFIEDTLASIEMDLEEYPTGDFDLEAVVGELDLTEKYLENFEYDLEKWRLTDTPHPDFAFRDLYENPIKIWIEADAHRIYSTGRDGVSMSGGLDDDDVWTGQPDKVRELVHKAYFDSWHEENRRNLWTHLFESI